MSSLDLIYITNDPELALNAQVAGVDRIMVDLEVLGKEERQRHLNTVKSQHSIDDIVKIRRVLDSAKLKVRINPIHDGSEIEINRVIEAGADIIMLPMFYSKHEVKRFIDIVSGRAKVVLLLETAAAVVRIEQILEVPGIDEIHIGLNDLHLSFKLDFMFELMVGDFLDYIVEKIKMKGIDFGIGGVGNPYVKETIPVDLILSEHVRLGSSLVILSRSFHNNHELFLKYNIQEAIDSVQKLKTIYADFQTANDLLLEKKDILREKVLSIVS